VAAVQIPDPATTGVDRLIDSYVRCLMFAERSPWFVKVEHSGSPPYRTWVLGSRGLRYLIARRVRRGVTLARRGVLRADAAGRDGKEQLRRLDELERSLPPLALTRQAIFALVLVSLALQFGGQLFGEASDLVNTVLRDSVTLDPNAAWKEIVKVDQAVRYRAVVLLTALLPIALFVPQWTFRLARIVFSVRPDTLPETVPSMWSPVRDPQQDTYAIEREVFQGLDVRRPRQLQLDLLFWGSLCGPAAFLAWAFTLNEVGEHRWLRAAAGMATLVSFTAVALGLWRRHRQREGGNAPPNINVRVVALVGVCVVTGALGLALGPGGLLPYRPPRGTVSDVAVVERAVSANDVGERTGSDPAGAVQPDVRRAISTRRPTEAVIGTTLSYVPAMRQSQCEGCSVRWVVYDADTQRVYWKGPGWPKRELTFADREAQPGRLWVPLPARAGRFVVKIEVVEPRKGRQISRAAADSAVLEFARPANPPAAKPPKK
jgi:hypothetical protein